MDKDTQQELERLEKELLTSEELSEDALISDDDLVAIFDDLADPVDDNRVYAQTFSDYDEELDAFAENGGELPQKRVFGDKLTIGLMLTASALCLGIIGVLIYWMEAFL